MTFGRKRLRCLFVWGYPWRQRCSVWFTSVVCDFLRKLLKSAGFRGPFLENLQFLLLECFVTRIQNALSCEPYNEDLLAFFQMIYVLGRTLPNFEFSTLPSFHVFVRPQVQGILFQPICSNFFKTKFVILNQVWYCVNNQKIWQHQNVLTTAVYDVTLLYRFADIYWVPWFSGVGFSRILYKSLSS